MVSTFNMFTISLLLAVTSAVGMKRICGVNADNGIFCAMDTNGVIMEWKKTTGFVETDYGAW